MADKTPDPPRPAWAHGARVGQGPVRDAVVKTRDAVASSLAELQKELQRKRALLAQFGRR